MAQYFEGFNSASLPTGWTPRWYDTTSWTMYANTQLNGSSASNIRLRLYSLDAVDGIANTEIVTRLWTEGLSTNVVAVLRASGAAGGAETCYVMQLVTPSTVRVCKIQNNAWTQISSATFASTDGAYYKARFRANGSTISYRIWRDADAEPATWTGSVTDDAIAAGGWAGACYYSNYGSRWDWMGIGTNGDPAPTSASGGTNASVTSVVATTSLATVAPSVTAQRQASLTGVAATVALATGIPSVTATSSADVLVTGIAATGSLVARAPGLSSGLTAIKAPVSLAVLAPGVSGTSNPVAVAASANLAAPAPTVSLGFVASVTAVSATLTLTVPAPVLSASSALTSIACAGSIRAPAPDPRTGCGIVEPAASLTLSIPTPSLATSAGISAAYSTATWAGIAPSITVVAADMTVAGAYAAMTIACPVPRIRPSDWYAGSTPAATWQTIARPSATWGDVTLPVATWR